MMEPQIQIVGESMDTDRGGLVTGIVFFAFDAFQFPGSKNHVEVLH